MKPLIVLLSAFFIATFGVRIALHGYDIPLAGRIAMAAMLLFTAIGHFAFTSGMALMVPGFIPFKRTIVYLTGLIEIVAAPCLLIPLTRSVTAWLLIVFFILLLPANIYAAAHHIDYQKGDSTGPGLKYLLFRIPLQLLFILWVYISAIIAVNGLMMSF